MHRVLWLLLACSLSSCFGSEKRTISLLFTPDGGLERSVHVRSGPRDDEVEEDLDFLRLGASPVAVHRLRTPLGALAWYTEPIGGTSDPIAAVRRIHAVAGLSADTLIAWWEEALAAEPGWPALRERIDVDLRRELEVIGLSMWGTGASIFGKGPEANEVFFQVSHSLSEVLGLDPAAVLRASAAQGRAAPQAAALLASLLAEALGTGPGEGAERLEPLCSPAAIEASWRSFAETPRAAALAARASEALARSLEPSELWQPLEEVLLRGDLFGLVAERVELRIASEPFLHTGTWDPEGKLVRQQRDLVEGPRRVFGAAWTEPDEPWQRAHLGGLVLDGRALSDYVMQAVALGPGAEASWSLFLESLSPGPGLADRIRSWTPPASDQQELLEGLRQALLDALGSAPTPPAGR